MSTRIIIVKLGSNIIVNEANQFDVGQASNLMDQLVKLKESGIQTVLVVSGALACGIGSMESVKPDDDLKKHVLAGIGQACLIHGFWEVCAGKKMRFAQVLLKRECLDDEVKNTMIHSVLLEMLAQGIIPVINENDAVSLNNFGGNDVLASEVAILLHAEQLVILSNVHGLLDLSKMNGSFSHEAEIINEVLPETDLSPYLSSSISQNGVGGMVSKIHAAQVLQKHGIPTTIAYGRESDVLVRIFNNKENIGTRFIVHGK